MGPAGLHDVGELALPSLRARAASASSAGSRSWVTSSSAARWTAVGKTSLEDWPMLTWSLGWARRRRGWRSPRWRSCSTRCRSRSGRRRPGTGRRARPRRPRRRRRRSAPRRRCRAAELAVGLRGGALVGPSQRTTGTGIGCPDTGKFSTALVVSPPQSCSVTVVPPSVQMSCVASQAYAAFAGDCRGVGCASSSRSACFPPGLESPARTRLRSSSQASGAGRRGRYVGRRRRGWRIRSAVDRLRSPRRSAARRRRPGSRAARSPRRPRSARRLGVQLGRRLAPCAIADAGQVARPAGLGGRHSLIGRRRPSSSPPRRAALSAVR